MTTTLMTPTRMSPTRMSPTRMSPTRMSPDMMPPSDFASGAVHRRLDPARLAAAKTAYTTRHLHTRLELGHDGYGLLSGSQVVPRAGDVVLARVAELGQHERLESSFSRRASLFVGDEVLVAYGARYAPDQFEAEVPQDLGPTNLVAAGGLAGTVCSAHAAMKPATLLEPIGLLTDAHGVVTLADCAPYAAGGAPLLARGGTHRPHVVAVLGTSMNSGKTTTVAAIVRGLHRAGLRVVAGKATGTGAGGDPSLFRDSGAQRVLDFTDFGHGSTYLMDHEAVADLFGAVVTELSGVGDPDVVVIEVADGLFQRETARLVRHRTFAQHVDTVVFAAGEALGALAGHQLLCELGHPPVAVSGLLTASPLARVEAASALSVPVLDRDELASSAGVAVLFGAGVGQSRGSRVPAAV